MRRSTSGMLRDSTTGQYHGLGSTIALIGVSEKIPPGPSILYGNPGTFAYVMNSVDEVLWDS
jgi:hypothetical protein